MLSLVLGIGANTLVFSLVNAFLIRPLPYSDPQRLVLVASVHQDRPGQMAGLTRGHCAMLRANTDVFEQFGCYTDPVAASLAEDDSANTFAEEVTGRQMAAGAAKALSGHPLLGRWFDEADEREGAERVLVIGFSLWQRRFGGSADVLGKRVRFNGETAAIIGVTPDDFEFLDLLTDYWTPYQSPANGAMSPARVLGAVARLRAGISLPRAQAAMDAYSAQMATESPETDRGWRINLRTLERDDDESIYSEARNPMMTLQSSVGFVLLIACANVAGLLLAQGTSQHKELAVRAALGSGRSRIFRQLLTHSLLLSFAGGVVGLLVGLAGLRILANSLAVQLPDILHETHLDPTVLLFTIGISVLSGLAVGIVPALYVSHAEPLDAMRDSGGRSTAGRSRQRLRGAFVVGQIALAFMLLVGAGLMLNSLRQAAAAPLGFDPRNLVTVELNLPDSKFRRPTRTVLASGALEMEIDPQMYVVSEKVRKSLGEIPGVSAASAIAIRPPFSGTINMPFRIGTNANVEALRAQFLPIMPDYFATLEVRVIQGREFTGQDRSGSQPVAVINRSMAERYWPNESAIGQLVTIDSPTLPNQPAREIIGIVDEVMQFPGQQSRPQLYIPYLQFSSRHDERLTDDLRRVTFIFRTPQPLPELIGPIRSAVSLADSGQAIRYIRSMRDTAYHSLERRRIYLGLLAGFGAIAMFLAVVGVYGVMAQVVSQRTNEIGIRMALGANRARVRSLVIRQGGRLIGVGLLIGVIGSVALTRVVRSSLFGVAAADPLTLALTVALLGGIGLVACYVPARRASQIDPMLALRHD
jgi:putative ABC transport system permease protein